MMEFHVATVDEGVCHQVEHEVSRTMDRSVNSAIDAVHIPKKIVAFIGVPVEG